MLWELAQAMVFCAKHFSGDGRKQTHHKAPQFLILLMFLRGHIAVWKSVIQVTFKSLFDATLTSCVEWMLNKKLLLSSRPDLSFLCRIYVR